MLFAMSILFCSAIAGAQSPRHRVVVEVNQPGSIAYGIVLGNVENLKKALAPDPVEVEVVCEGAGLDMLYVNGSQADRVKKLHTKGVVFAACANTIRFKKIDRKKLLPFVVVVPAGVAEVVRKQEAGWSYLKGAY